MIGYLQPAQLKGSDKLLFRSTQCGICHAIGAEYGFVYRAFAGVDLVFFNIFAEMFSAVKAVAQRRACVLSPLGERGPTLPSREANENTRFAAAFGVWIGAEKLRDDYEDEGGWHRFVALRLLARGRARARATLAERGFPIAAVEALMRQQAAIERAPALSLDLAIGPTRGIARALFSSVGTTEAQRTELGELGARVGDYLFWMDNLLDFHRDARAKQYNALARAGLDAAGAFLVAVAGAKQQLAALKTHTAQLPMDEYGLYVRNTLVGGLAGVLERYLAISAPARPNATLGRIRRALNPMSRATQLRLALAFVLVYWLPMVPGVPKLAGWLGGVAWAQENPEDDQNICERVAEWCTGICCEPICDAACDDVDLCGGLTCDVGGCGC